MGGVLGGVIYKKLISALQHTYFLSSDGELGD